MFLIYMAIPILITIGLCIFSYMTGRYIRIGKKQEEVKAPEIIKEPEPPKEPDRVPILEEEIRKLKEALEIKNKELEERTKAAELIMEENQKLLAQARQEESLSQLEKEPAADNIAALPVSSSDEDVPKEPAEKMKRKKPEEKKKDNPRRKKR